MWGEVAARRLDVACVVGLAVWLAVDLTGKTVFGSVPWPDSVVDYRIIYDNGRAVFETHRYPANYPYPPSAVALHAVTAVPPYQVAAAIWLALTGLAAVATYGVLAYTLGMHRRPGFGAALLLAHVAVAYYYQWDMRSLNCNLIVCAAVLFGGAALVAGRDRTAGFWFAAAVALKVFPVLLLPYLAWVRRWRALAWAVGWTVVFWIGVPLLAFGGGAGEVYAGWFGELARATDPALKHVHPILISLEKAALHLAGERASILVYAVCGVWTAVGLFGAAASRAMSCVNGARDPACVFAHITLLTIGPAAVGPYLEPYHLVALVAPAVVLGAIAVDVRQAARVRAVAFAGLALAIAVRHWPNLWEVRGLVVNVQALLLCATAVWTTWSVAAARGETATSPQRSDRAVGLPPRVAPGLSAA